MVFILGTWYLNLRVLRLHMGEVCCKRTRHCGALDGVRCSAWGDPPVGGGCVQLIGSIRANDQDQKISLLTRKNTFVVYIKSLSLYPSLSLCAHVLSMLSCRALFTLV